MKRLFSLLFILIFSMTASAALLLSMFQKQQKIRIENRANDGDAEAQYSLGEIYELGLYATSIDCDQAVYWYNKSAGQGNAKAQYRLGGCYEEGKGVAQDYSIAKTWYENARRNGYDNKKEITEAIKRIKQKERIQKNRQRTQEHSGPISYEETMLDLEKKQIEARLSVLRKEQDAYAKLCSEEAKNSAPTFGIDAPEPPVATKAFVPPYLKIVNYSISSQYGKVHRMELFALHLAIQNIKDEDAENVNILISIPDNVVIMEGNKNISFNHIKPGEIKPMTFFMAVKNNYTESSIPISIDIKEKYGKYAENKKIDVEIDAGPINIGKITLVGTPHISILTNTSVAIMRPEWYSKYHHPQNIKSPFPYAVIQLELKGDKESIDLAKRRLSLIMGGKHIVTEKDTKETNTIWFLVHCRNEYIDLDCGDGCEPINIWNERLEPNKVYSGSITVSVQ